jgi:hypothetical protein
VFQHVYLSPRPDGAALYPDDVDVFGALHQLDTDLVVQLTGILARHFPSDAPI